MRSEKTERRENVRQSRSYIRAVTGRGALWRPTWLERILTYFDVRKTRLDLARLDERGLYDVGLTREAVEAELKRSHWDAPSYMKADADEKKYRDISEHPV